MILMTIFLGILTLVALYITRYFLQLWHYTKKVEKLPTTKHHPIFGHALNLLVQTGKYNTIHLHNYSSGSNMVKARIFVENYTL